MGHVAYNKEQLGLPRYVTPLQPAGSIPRDIITKVHQAMASEEFEPMSQKMVAKTAAKIPDYLVDFVKFKRETVRLDYTAERLRSACRKVEKQREEMVAKLKEEEDSITVQAMECQKRRLEDDQKTLEIQTMAREMAERKRILQQEVETSQSLIKELIRKKNKLQHWLQELEERRAFLSQIIGHKVRTRLNKHSVRMMHFITHDHCNLKGKSKDAE